MMYDRCMILKTNKGQGIVLINKSIIINYSNDCLLIERSFRFYLDHDATLTNLATICNYIQTIYKGGEINEAEMKEMRPKAA